LDLGIIIAALVEDPGSERPVSTSLTVTLRVIVQNRFKKSDGSVWLNVVENIILLAPPLPTTVEPDELYTVLDTAVSCLVTVNIGAAVYVKLGGG
jgi:hypothetical protein